MEAKIIDEVCKKLLAKIEQNVDQIPKDIMKFVNMTYNLVRGQMETMNA